MRRDSGARSLCRERPQFPTFAAGYDYWMAVLTTPVGALSVPLAE